MTRRQLLKLLLSSSIAEVIDVEKLLWIPGQMVSIPSRALTKEIMNQAFDASLLSLTGIPYHQSNASTGTWLGFERTTHPEIKSKRLINRYVNIDKN